MINLILAIVWALAGVALIVYHHLTGDPQWRINLLAGKPSLGWAALLLSLYNAARYWSYRSAVATRRELEASRARREALTSHRPKVEYGEPNPDFRFTDEPPPES